MLLNKTIPENFFALAETHAKKPVLSYKKDGVYFSLTFGELAAKVRKFAAALSGAGINCGDRVAILAHNRTEWAIADLGAMTAGAIGVPIHAVLSPKIINYVLEHSGAKILVVAGLDLLNKVFVFQNDLRFLKKIVFIGEVDNESRSISIKPIINWEDFLAATGEAALAPIKSDVGDVCSIIYTSGTTGLPKGVELTYANFLHNILATHQAVPVKKGDVFLSFLPLSHVLERMAGYYTPLLMGGRIVYAESFKTLALNLKEVKPTMLIAVPRVFEKFHDTIWDKVTAEGKLKKKIFYWALKQRKSSLGYYLASRMVFKKVRQALGGRLRFAVSGGASLDGKIAKFFDKLGIAILEGYGLTETSPVVAVNREKSFKFGAVGVPLGNVEVKIMPDKEIAVRGPSVMKGYYRDDSATALAIDKDGWFYTGDLGFVDRDGFLVIIGRKKEMMVTSGGKNVWPEVVEQEINRDKFIEQSAIVCHNRPFVAALIVPDWEEVSLYLKENHWPEKSHSELARDPQIIAVIKDRMAKINEHLSDYEQIRNFRILTREFSQDRDELTPTLKLRRHVISSHYEKEIEEMYR